MLAKILDSLSDYRLSPPATTNTADSSKACIFSGTYSNQQSTQPAYAQSALSFGLSGSYGSYSGSCQADKENERESASEVINGTLAAVAEYDTLTFKRSEDPMAIAAHLDPCCCTRSMPSTRRPLPRPSPASTAPTLCWACIWAASSRWW